MQGSEGYHFLLWVHSTWATCEMRRQLDTKVHRQSSAAHWHVLPRQWETLGKRITLGALLSGLEHRRKQQAVIDARRFRTAWSQGTVRTQGVWGRTKAVSAAKRSGHSAAWGGQGPGQSTSSGGGWKSDYSELKTGESENETPGLFWKLLLGGQYMEWSLKGTVVSKQMWLLEGRHKWHLYFDSYLMEM